MAGGTGFWVRAITAGLDTEALPFDPAVRAALEAELRAQGLPELAARLRREAPSLAATVDLANPRRVVRALEIAALRGDAPRPAPLGYPAPILPLLLDLDHATHRRRLADRARAQFDAGLVDEALALRARFDPGLPAFSAIGYREAWAFVDGDLDREGAIALDARRNVAFAKRQRTWFRREAGERVDASGGMPRDLADRALRLLDGPAVGGRR